MGKEHLPEEFLIQMKQLLGGEYADFLASYEQPCQKALRVNTLKLSVEEFMRMQPFTLQPIPWVKEGYCYEQAPVSDGDALPDGYRGDLPGRHPYHAAGLYYIQEPSAMYPVEALFYDGTTSGTATGSSDTPDAVRVSMSSGAPDGNIRDNERILDLCASPGGKSTQIAAKLRGRGILISNEIHPARAKILSENMERMGVKNALVTNESPERLAELFDGYFTRILVDAPCSGEGMFRKNPEACTQWNPSNVALCAERQTRILEAAAGMLTPGGRLVYSTCTFNTTENEENIARFLEAHPEFSLQPSNMDKKTGLVPGKDGLGIKLFPHRISGEGHYVAVLQKDGTCPTERFPLCRNGLEQGIPQSDFHRPERGILEWEAFAKEELITAPDGIFVRFGEHLYLVPKGMISLRGVKVLRAGLHLGSIKKNRFEPAHALAAALKREEVSHTADFSPDEILPYLKGQTMQAGGEKGYYLVTVDGFGIGWAKLAGGILKNRYPKGLRIQ